MKLTEQTEFLGRNGLFKCNGFEISVYVKPNYQKVIMIEPLTSRGQIGRCAIEIPHSDLQTFINQLQEKV
jgi:hypothetical protein